MFLTTKDKKLPFLFHNGWAFPRWHCRLRQHRPQLRCISWCLRSFSLCPFAAGPSIGWNRHTQTVIRKLNHQNVPVANETHLYGLESTTSADISRILCSADSTAFGDSVSSIRVFLKFSMRFLMFSTSSKDMVTVKCEKSSAKRKSKSSTCTNRTAGRRQSVMMQFRDGGKSTRRKSSKNE